MCDCIKKNEAAAIAFLKEKHPTAKVNDSASLVNQAAVRVQDRLAAVSFDEYQVWVQLAKKGGGLANSKQLKVTFVHAYCPHCGEKRS